MGVESWGRAALSAVGVAVGLGGCGDERDPSMLTSSSTFPPIGGETGTGIGDGNGDGDGDDGVGDGGEKFDVAAAGSDGTIPCGEGGDCDNECEATAHVPCDDGTTDLFHAVGLGCPGEAPVTPTVDGSVAAMAIRSGFGNTAEWAPREGTVFAVLGSGFTLDLDMATPPGDFNLEPTHCNDDLGGEFDKGGTLPAPIRTTDVAGDCAADPTVLGTGDCSSTIHAQFIQGGTANDYTELRVEATVPPTANSISYDFAFFSTEYPAYYGSMFNDMYIGWLESESWTGNISFDNQGQPISLNAGFLDFRDDGGNVPELAGTCMRQHAGTKWLATTAPVTPGEEIILVLAIFDLGDSALDSYVFLDNFGWGCDGSSTPETVPVG